MCNAVSSNFTVSNFFELFPSVYLYGGLTRGSTPVPASAPCALRSLLVSVPLWLYGSWSIRNDSNCKYSVKVRDCRSWPEQNGENEMLLRHWDRQGGCRTPYNWGEPTENCMSTRVAHHGGRFMPGRTCCCEKLGCVTCCILSLC